MSAGFNMRTFCGCGWSIPTTHGNVWFAQKQYPCCPKCGAPASNYVARIVSWNDRDHIWQPHEPLPEPAAPAASVQSRLGWFCAGIVAGAALGLLCVQIACNLGAFG